MEAMFWARLAASHGHVDDAIVLAAVLTALAEYWGYDREDAAWGNLLLAEGVALLDSLAADGNEAAATAINEFSHRVAPRIFTQAKQVIDARTSSGRPSQVWPATSAATMSSAPAALMRTDAHFHA
ncbi:hypothetical protein [Sphingobium yanoikuyae]|uniref:hypothetical protein n=1 Tax=Sphingobium yanoikuyae TaxID=13690 RepID=UPI0002F9E865|nr:hypothetical protein [Sphingobium yanoikuyae]